MANCILALSLFVSVVSMTLGQSTTGENSGCVYTFNVPASYCGHTSGSSDADDQIWKSFFALQTQFNELRREERAHNEKLANDNEKLAKEVVNLQKQLASITSGPENQPSSKGGAVYIRWGRKTCPGNGTTLVYSGVAGGTDHHRTGGGSNYLCLSRDPEWGAKPSSGFQDPSGSLLYGAEYHVYSNRYFSTENAHSLHDNDVPCAACLATGRSMTLMIPAKLTCPDGWTREYAGYLMAERDVHGNSKSYVCMDNAPEVIEGGAANMDGALFYHVEAKCGSLPCPNYIDGWDITCVLCSK